MITHSPAPAAWYPDPGDASGPLRWWDGERWSVWQSIGGQQPVEVPLSLEGAAAAWDALRDHRAPWPAAVAWVAVAALVASFVVADLFVRAADLVGFSTAAQQLAVGAVGLYAVLLGTCWLVQRRWGTPGGFRRDFGLERRSGDVVKGLLASLLARGLAIPAILVLVLLLRDVEHSSLQVDYSDEFGWTAIGVFAVVALVLAPFFEELFFRGLLQRSLESVLPGWLAVSVGALLFGLAHASWSLGASNLFVVAPIAIGGVVLGRLARRHQRLGPGIASHACFNAVPILVLVVLQAAR